MMTISVCIGSACHKRGSYAILNRFKALVEERAFRIRFPLPLHSALGNARTA